MVKYFSHGQRVVWLMLSQMRLLWGAWQSRMRWSIECIHWRPRIALLSLRVVIEMLIYDLGKLLRLGQTIRTLSWLSSWLKTLSSNYGSLVDSVVNALIHFGLVLLKGVLLLSFIICENLWFLNEPFSPLTDFSTLWSRTLSNCGSCRNSSHFVLLCLLLLSLLGYFLQLLLWLS